MPKGVEPYVFIARADLGDERGQLRFCLRNSDCLHREKSSDDHLGRSNWPGWSFQKTIPALVKG